MRVWALLGSTHTRCTWVSLLVLQFFLLGSFTSAQPWDAFMTKGWTCLTPTSFAMQATQP